MKLRLLATALAILALTASPARAATMSASSTAPVVNGLDIANYGAVTGNDKWFFENSAAGAAKGQTFKTGTVAALLKSISYQVTASQMAAPTKGYTIRVGTVSGTAFTQIASETATQTFTWNGGEYMTWTFATPVLLAANTTYGIDVGMTSSTSGWTTGIPYLNVTANGYTNGAQYSSGTNGLGTATIATTSNDRIFHLDLQHPMNPSPDFGVQVPAGDLTLSWTNMTPTTGTDVWVDVWFGTAPGSMTKIASTQQNLTSFLVNLPGANTYYWRIDSYLDGAPTGTPVQSSVFNFIVTDSDGDGFPDTYELANTTPASATALNIGDDLEPDGLTNWQEFQLGTSPTNPDTDGDTLQDGPELTGVGARPATDPKKADTDGDGLNDGIETNTATWVSAANTGTNPTKADTDSDGLKDGVETNTATYVSASNTGTNPLAADSDGDNAGDWYEVAAAFTNPTIGTSKPNIPYPLPAPDSGAGVTNKPVKVYIMSGQSNMVGFGRTPGTVAGTLNTIVKSENKFPNLVTGTGTWAARQDVRYRGVISAIGNDVLKPQFGANTDSFGPELGFGHVMGWYHDEPVLLLKTSIGNRSLFWDCLPPGGARYNYNGQTYAGYGESPNSWTIGGSPSPFVWYAGKQYDDYFLAEADMGPGMTWVSGRVFPDGCQIRHNGVIYISKDRKNPDGTDIPNHTAAPESEPSVGANWSTYWSVYSVFNVTDVLDNFATQYPTWAAQGFEIAGYVWFQGNKDLGEPAASRYEANLVPFIKSVRTYYANRYPGKCSTTTPFVIATGCGDPGTSGGGLTVANGQLAMNDAVKYPEFAGNVKTMDTRGYWRSFGPSTQGYHYNHNAETYMLTGDALGRGMIGLIGSTTPPGNTFANWIAGYPVAAGLGGFSQDADGDGIDNGAENFFGTNPSVGSSGLIPGAANGNTFAFTHPQNSTPATGVTGIYRWSKDLATFRGHGQTDGDGTMVNFSPPVTNSGITTVTATVTGTATAKLFVDVKVTQN